MKTVLLHIHEDSGQESRLSFALDLARAFEAHLACVQATPYDAYMGGDMFGGSYVARDVLADLREREAEARTRIEARLTSEGVSWDWKQVDGPVVRTLVRETRLADALILSQASGPTGGKEMSPMPILSDVVLHASAPIFMVQRAVRPFDPNGKAMVAWNGSPEAANALRRALPFLHMAGSVDLVEVTGETSEFPSTAAAEYLSRHGLSPDVHQWPRDSHDIALTLRRAAHDLGAAYLVMGAYGHSRLRETVLGGVTRSLLADSDIPLLLSH